jgi:hypothetical protein
LLCGVCVVGAVWLSACGSSATSMTTQSSSASVSSGSSSSKSGSSSSATAAALTPERLVLAAQDVPPGYHEQSRAPSMGSTPDRSLEVLYVAPDKSLVSLAIILSTTDDAAITFGSARDKLLSFSGARQLSGPSVGDESVLVSFNEAGTQQVALIWRHGRVFCDVDLGEGAAPPSPETAGALARTQDAKVVAALGR